MRPSVAMAPGKFALCQAARSGVLANDSHALGYEQPVEAELLVLLSAVVARCFPLTMDGPAPLKHVDKRSFV